MTTTRRQFIQSSAAALAVASPLAFPSLVRADSAKEFRLGLITPAGHSWNRAALQFGEALKKETNGRLSVTVFHSGQLGNEAAMMQQMQSGALDMGWIQAAELGSRVSSVAAINAPYLVRSTPAVAKQDGVDFVPMKAWKNTLINLLNIAGTGPVLGPIQGILFGPIAFLTIPIG